MSVRSFKIYRTVLPSDRSLSIIALVSRKPRKRTKKVRTSGFEHYPNGALIRPEVFTFCQKQRDLAKGMEK